MEIEQLGPYRIVRRLGHGGMGTVYEGVHVETGGAAAVKLLSASLAQQEGFRSRFEGEIETLRKLNHPNIVRLFGFGEQAGQLFYAMELVDGNSLEEELERGRRFDWREVTRIGIRICGALRHAHDRGVIHRDIKPGNLLLAGDDQVKLSDFGIARLFGYARLTNAGNVLGTAEYMAPEQAAGRPAGPRADLYSLGAVFYALLTRRQLFRAGSLPEVLHKQRFETPEPVSRYAPDVPAMLEEIIAQLLQKDPDRRIPNAALLARQLAAMEHALSRLPDTLQIDADEPAPSDADLGAHVAAGDPPQPGRLPPTRTAEQSPDRPSAADAPAPAADELLETKATAAFQALAAVETPQGDREPDTHFTLIAEEELDRMQADRPHAAWISLQTWALAASLLAVGLTVWYFLQGPSSDALYERIMAQGASKSVTSLRQAQSDVQEFLMRFPGDSRCDQLRRHEKEIELRLLQRRFDLRAKGLAGAEELTPIEREYLAALGYLRLDPERAAARLQALVDLYGHGRDTADSTGKCLELARRQLKRLREDLDQHAVGHFALVQARLERAEQLSHTEPDRARSMYRAVIELYADKPWAANAVRRARTALEGDFQAVQK